MSLQNGMLWLDNSQDDLCVKVKRGADHYAKTRGQAPEICFVHPSISPTGEDCYIGDVSVRISQSLLVEHLYFLGDSTNGNEGEPSQ